MFSVRFHYLTRQPMLLPIVSFLVASTQVLARVKVQSTKPAWLLGSCWNITTNLLQVDI